MSEDNQVIKHSPIKLILISISFYLIILGSLIPIFYFTIDYMIENIVNVSINDYILLGTILLLGILFLVYLCVNLILKNHLLEYSKTDNFNQSGINKKITLSNNFIKTTLILFFYLLSFVLTYFSVKVIPSSYHQFTFLDILNGIIFLIWLLFGAFILDYYNVLSFYKTLTYFLIFCLLFSTVDLLITKILISIPLALYLVLVIIITAIRDQNNKKNFQYYLDTILNKRSNTLVIISFIVLSALLQIIWSFASPDSTAYFLSARNFLETGTLKIFEPLLEYSSGFIRKLFFQSSDLYMITQYPFGGIYLLAFFMKYAVYWRILFVIISIIFANQISNLYENFYQRKPAPIHLFIILFLSEILVKITTGYSVDIIGIIFSLVALNSCLNFLNKNNKIAIFNLIAFLVVLPLIKPVVFIFTLIVIFFVVIYTYITNQSVKSAAKSFFKKRRNIILFSFASLIILALFVWGLYVSFTGYLQNFDLIGKFLRPFQIPAKTFANFGINLLQLILVYFIFFIDFFIPKKIKEKYEIVVDKKQRNLIVIPLLVIFVIFIFFWNSSNFYPFDIACRYFLLIGLVSAIFSKIHKYPKKFKTVLITYVVLTNCYFIVHSASLDYKNKVFAGNVTGFLEDSDIVITNYYSKLLPDNIVFYGNYETILYTEVTLAKIEFLLDNNFTLYFIPEGVVSFDEVILNNFEYELIYEMERSLFERILFPKIGSIDFLNPAPRELYLLTN